MCGARALVNEEFNYKENYPNEIQRNLIVTIVGSLLSIAVWLPSGQIGQAQKSRLLGLDCEISPLQF